MKNSPKIYLVLALLILIVLRIPSLFESYWYGDEAIYAAVADEMSQGKNLYSEAWDHKPPLIFWVFLPAAHIGWGIGFALLRAFNILLGVLSLIFVDRILRKSVGNAPRFVSLVFFSLLLGSTLLEGNILNAEVIFMVINTLAVLLFVSKKYFYLAGFLAFLSLITKVPGFVELVLVFAAFTLIYIKEKGFKFAFWSIAKMAVGFIAPLVLMLIFFQAKGTMPDFIYANAVFNQIYSLHQSNYFELLGRQFPNTYLQLFSFVSVFVFTTILYWKQKISTFTYFSINLFTAEIFASLLSAKNYAHYFLQILPGTVLLLGIFLQKIRIIIKPQNLAYSFLIAVLLIPSFLVFWRGGVIAVHAPPEKYYPTFVKGYLRGDSFAKSQFWWGRQEQVENVSKYLDNNYRDSPAYIYTSKPWVIALTDIALKNKYVVWFHLAYRDVHLNEELEKMRAAEIFILDKDNQLLEPVDSLLDNEFEIIDEYGSFEIYHRI